MVSSSRDLLLQGNAILGLGSAQTLWNSSGNAQATVAVPLDFDRCPSGLMRRCSYMSGAGPEAVRGIESKAGEVYRSGITRR